jgi:P-type Cu+ transporter
MIRTTPSPRLTTLELPVGGMDCAERARHIEQGVRALPGVYDVQVLVTAERATMSFDPERVTPDQIKAAIGEAGYTVREVAGAEPREPKRQDVIQIIGWGALAIVAVVVMVAALGERLGLFDAALERLPWWLPALAIVLGGWRVFSGVLRAARRAKVTSHTLMTAGVIASIAIGQWTTAALIVFFMRFADWLEDLTTERSRQALRQLIALQPATAHVLEDGKERAVPVSEVRVGDIVVICPGERIPVDGQVLDGHAPVDQAPITGESVPVEKAPGDFVFAATVAQAGFLKVQATKVGSDTTFARIVRLVEETEAHKAPVQRFADRFSAYYLPGVLLLALATYLVSGHVMNAVAVLVVACACAIALATPVVVLASVGSAARRGLLVKGGCSLEQLARVNTLVMDKTGTLTLGKPRVTDVMAFNGFTDRDVLRVIAGIESRSEHPLGKAILRAAAEQDIAPSEPEAFTPLPGRGLLGTLDGHSWAVGNRRLLTERGLSVDVTHETKARALELEPTFESSLCITPNFDAVLHRSRVHSPGDGGRGVDARSASLPADALALSPAA